MNSKKIVVIADPEGNHKAVWDSLAPYFSLPQSNDSHVDISAFQIKRLVPDIHVVILGDVPDKGPGSTKIFQLLKNLHSTFPKNVTLIAGNRDINKFRLAFAIRFYRKLRTDYQKIVLSHMMHWVKLGTTYEAFLAEQRVTNFSFPDSEISFLRFYMQKTMGIQVPDLFFDEICELYEIKMPATESIYSHTVLGDSILHLCSRNAPIGYYLAHSQIMYLHGDQDLFVHGGLGAKYMIDLYGNPVNCGNIAELANLVNRQYAEMVELEFQNQEKELTITLVETNTRAPFVHDSKGIPRQVVQIGDSTFSVHIPNFQLQQIGLPENVERMGTGVYVTGNTFDKQNLRPESISKE
jgi:calcineurin-like phosphoesterase family protein